MKYLRGTSPMVSKLMVSLASLFWGIHNQGEPQRINIDHFTSGYVHGLPGEDMHLPEPAQNSRTVVVAVLDTGIDSSHPELSNVLAGKGYNFVNSNEDTTDLHGHGTHISGIIAKQVSNHAKILPVKVVQTGPNAPIRPQSTEPGAGTALTENVAQGVIYAIEKGAEVINLSLAWPASIRSKKMDEAMKLAEDRNVLVVASAANDSTSANLYPCIYRNVICVGAHGPDGAFTYFSNHGSMVDLLAPGIAILSTWPMNKPPVTFAGQTGYEFRNGTSMAAPFVAGAVAELLARGFSPKEAKNRLLLGTRKTRKESLYTTAVVGQYSHNLNETVKTSRFGNLDLSQALMVDPSSLILPLEKAETEVNWNGSDPGVAVPVRWKNFWKETKSVRIEIDGELFSLESIKEEETFEILIHLSLDEKTENRLLKIAAITTVEKDGSIQKRSIPLSFHIKRILSPETLPSNSIRYRLDGSLLGEGVSVRSVVGELPSGGHELYFIRKNEITLTRNGTTLGKINLPGTTPESILNLYRLSDDQGYALVSTRQERGESRPSFLIHDLDSHLNLLSETRIGTEITVLNEKLVWKKTKSRPVPLWISIGYTPEDQKPSKDPWNPEIQDFKMPRIYYLDQSQLRSLILEEDELPLQILPGGSILISKGEGYFIRYFILDLDLQSENSIRSKNELSMTSYRMLIGTEGSGPVLNLDGSPSTTTSWVGLSSPGNLRSTFLDVNTSSTKNDIVLRRSGTLESLIQVSGSYVQNEKSFYFVQTHHELKFFRSSSNETGSVSLNRYSYIPSMIFMKNFFPVIARDEQGKGIPAIYVPASIANGGVSEVILGDPETGRVSRPVSLHFEARGKCQGIGNLLQLEPQGPTLQVFLCGDEAVLIPITTGKSPSPSH